MSTKPNHTKMFPKGRLWDISYDVRKNTREIKGKKSELEKLYASLNERLSATGGKITSEVRVIQADIETAHMVVSELNKDTRRLESEALELLRSDDSWEEVPNCAFW